MRSPMLAAAAVMALARPLLPDSATLPAAPPETVGLSSERLVRLDATMRRYVDERRIAGVVTMVVRSGRVAHHRATGMADAEKGVAMAPDTIFRVASMTKAVTTVAAMMLVEEGRLTLGDPVARYIPSFAHTTVIVSPAADAAPGSPAATVPARRPITLRDLLTHTAGISYGWGPAEAQYRAANMLGWYCADRAEPMAAGIERLAALPYDSQPGEKWIYGFGLDVVGVVVEKVSGLSLDEFFRTRILDPLRMRDTHFFLPPEKRGRLAAVYSAREGRMARGDGPGMEGQGDYVDGPRQCHSGGAGLLSTASDYARFLQMLLNGGQLDGVRLLGPKTVDLMTADHVGPLYPEAGTGFGLGFEVVEQQGRAGRYGTPGEYHWGGAYYTAYWVDPREQLIALFMTQLLPRGDIDLEEKWRALVYQAIVGPPRPVTKRP